MKNIAIKIVFVAAIMSRSEAIDLGGYSLTGTNPPAPGPTSLFGNSQTLTNSQITAYQTAAAPPVVVERYNFTGVGGPADGLGAPFTDTRNITNSQILSITDLNVSVKLTNPQQAGAFNGDIYLSLQHSSGFSVLLNRVGRRDDASPSASLGYGDNGFNVTFDDQAAQGDIHVYREKLFGNDTTPIDPTYTFALTGLWAPDARDTSPLTVTTPNSRTAFLDSFNLLSVNGAWTLMAIDYNGGGVSYLEQWGFEVVGSTIPEPSTTGLCVIGILACLLRKKARPKP